MRCQCGSLQFPAGHSVTGATRREERKRVRYSSLVKTHESVESGARAITALAPALMNLEREVRGAVEFERVVRRGHFTPEEDLNLRTWFAGCL